MKKEDIIDRIVGYDTVVQAINKKGVIYPCLMIAWGRVVDTVDYENEMLTAKVKNIHTGILSSISILKINTVMPSSY